MSEFITGYRAALREFMARKGQPVTIDHDSRDRYPHTVTGGPMDAATEAVALGDVDLPAGYRWAREDEMAREDAIVVPRTADSTGRPYTQGEADLAVPVSEKT